MTRNSLYRAYKKAGSIAEQAVQNGEFLKAERHFLESAKLRLAFRDTYCNGVWDEGHETRYHICIGSAWIQRQAYEDDKIIDSISYERDKPTSRPWSVWETKHAKKDMSFDFLMKKHAEIKKRRKSKN